MTRTVGMVAMLVLGIVAGAAVMYPASDPTKQVAPQQPEPVPQPAFATQVTPPAEPARLPESLTGRVANPAARSSSIQLVSGEFQPTAPTAAPAAPPPPVPLSLDKIAESVTVSAQAETITWGD